MTGSLRPWSAGMMDPGSWPIHTQRLVMGAAWVAALWAAWVSTIGPGLDSLHEARLRHSHLDIAAAPPLEIGPVDVGHLQQTESQLASHLWPPDSAAGLLLSLRAAAAGCGLRIELLESVPAASPTAPRAGSTPSRIHLKVGGAYADVRHFLATVSAWPLAVAWQAVRLSKPAHALQDSGAATRHADGGGVSLDATVAAVELPAGAVPGEGPVRDVPEPPAWTGTCVAKQTVPWAQPDPFDGARALTIPQDRSEGTAPQPVGFLAGASGGVSLWREGHEVHMAPLRHPYGMASAAVAGAEGAVAVQGQRASGAGGVGR